MKDPATIFKAIADSNRRKILQALKERDLTAGEIVALFTISAPAVSRHLSILKAAELVTERRSGNSIIYSLNAAHLSLCLSEFISKVCPLEILERKLKASGRTSKAKDGGK